MERSKQVITIAKQDYFSDVFVLDMLNIITDTLKAEMVENQPLFTDYQMRVIDKLINDIKGECSLLDLED